MQLCFFTIFYLMNDEMKMLSLFFTRFFLWFHINLTFAVSFGHCSFVRKEHTFRSRWKIMIEIYFPIFIWLSCLFVSKMENWCAWQKNHISSIKSRKMKWSRVSVANNPEEKKANKQTSQPASHPSIHPASIHILCHPFASVYR